MVGIPLQATYQMSVVTNGGNERVIEDVALDLEVSPLAHALPQRIGGQRGDREGAPATPLMPGYRRTSAPGGGRALAVVA